MWHDNGSVNPLHLHTICEEMSIYMKSVFLVVYLHIWYDVRSIIHGALNLSYNWRVSN
jgi:hypothetical protein